MQSKEHMKDVHGPVVCEKCEFEAADNAKLRKHESIEHEISSPSVHKEEVMEPHDKDDSYSKDNTTVSPSHFKCDRSGAMFASITHSKEHMKDVHGSAVCEKCGFEAADNAKLRKHENIEHGISSPSVHKEEVMEHHEDEDKDDSYSKDEYNS